MESSGYSGDYYLHEDEDFFFPIQHIVQHEMTVVYKYAPFPERKDITVLLGPIDYMSWEDNYSDWLGKELVDGDTPQNFLRIFSTVCYSLFFCISLAGNGFLLWALLKFEDLRRTSNLLLLHLTLSDLIFTLPLPIWAANFSGRWLMGDMACKLLKGVWSLGLYSYMAFLTAMTVHRYNAVMHALTTSVFKHCVHTVCIILWLLCLLCTVPEFVVHKAKSVIDTENQYCIENYGSDLTDYVVNYTQIIFFFFLPFGVIVFCHLKMWFRIQQCKMAKKRKTLRLIFLITVGFFICWAPYNIFLFLLLLSFLGAIPQDMFKNMVAFEAHYTISNSLISLHCGLSPLVHIFGTQKFRERLPFSYSLRRHLVRENAQSVTPQVMETADTAQTSVQSPV